MILIAVLSRNAVHQAEPKTPVVNLFLVEPGGSPFKIVNGEFANSFGLSALLPFGPISRDPLRILPTQRTPQSNDAYTAADTGRE